MTLEQRIKELEEEIQELKEQRKGLAEMLVKSYIAHMEAAPTRVENHPSAEA